jgi:Ca2+-binding RTX toxin-like protein/methionine-rich copper-binding protein CopC
MLAVTGVGMAMTPAVAVTDTNPDFLLIEEDLEHILKQIQIAEAHAAGGRLLCDTPTDTSGKCVPDAALPYGLRTVDGSFNNLENPKYGAADEFFPRLLEPRWRGADAEAPFPPFLNANDPADMEPCEDGTTCYAQEKGNVYDAEPRIISNLIVDQTTNNPAAVNAAANHEGSTTDADGNVFIPNTTADEALSAPFNAWFTFFGQFFDHGLDLVNKGGNDTLVVPLKPDDPLYNDPRSHGANFLTLTRATQYKDADGNVVNKNQTTPFIDQNQTYTSHPSHQFFLREYKLVSGKPMATGKLLNGPDVDADGERDGLATWKDVKEQARTVLGIDLVDTDVLNVPMVATDLYGNFLPGDNGFPVLIHKDKSQHEANLNTPISTADAMDTNHAFLDDIAHGAAPDPNGLSGYDNVALDEHFVTGDGRGNENIGLTAVHHVFHSEHNRMVGEIEKILDRPGNEELKKAFQGVDNQYKELLGEATIPDGPEADDWSYEERLFQAAKFPTEMQYQHLVFEEFARKVQPAIDAIVLNENSYDATINPAIVAEYAHVVYRFGHSMLTETIDRRGIPGAEDVSLLDGFLNPRTYDNNGSLHPDEAAGAIVNGTTNQVGGQIDELVIDTLRNNLLGLPLDLATINIVRARDAGVPPLQTARKTFFDATGDPMLKPYTSWTDFGLNLKNGDNFGRVTDNPNASLVNFVAAYGKHPTLIDPAVDTVAEMRAAADLLVNGGPGAPDDRVAFMESTGAWHVDNGTNTGLEDVDFWVGGLAEALEPFGGMLGSTFNFVFEKQIEDLQFGDRFYYLFRNQGNQLFSALEGNSFAGLIQRNTDASLLPADIFAVQDPYLDLEALPDVWPTQLSQMPDGTYRWDGDEHIEIHGNRTFADKIRADEGDDALWGYGGDDRIEGGAGNDSHIGGPGNDILTDTFGDDNIKGGFGNDAIRGGAGDDLLLAGHGHDYVQAGNDFKQVFASTGRDVLIGGTGRDTFFGGEHDDWLQGGAHADLLQGDNANQFQNNPHGGHDVVDGGIGNDDVEGEGGDDIIVGRPQGTDRMEGMQGYDWVTYRGDTTGVDVDLRFTTLQRPDNQAVRDRFDLVEGISGGAGDDVLRGMGSEIDDISEADLRASKMTPESIARIEGLGELLDPGHVKNYADRFMVQEIGFDTDGVANLLLGGSGSDRFESRIGDDFLEGDAYLDVYLEYNGTRYADANALQAGIFDGSIDPGDIKIVRKIATAANQANVKDTAIYGAVSSEYTITDLGDGYWQVAHDQTATEGEEAEGSDVLRNIEYVQFNDGCFLLSEGPLVPCDSYGVASIDDDPAPREDVPVTANVVLSNAAVDNPTNVTFRWLNREADGTEWLASAVQKATNCAVNGAGDTECSVSFAPGDAEFDTILKVEVTFVDDEGVLRSVISPETTNPVIGVNDAPIGPFLSTESPFVGERVDATGLEDHDGLEEAGETLLWVWETSSTRNGPWAQVAEYPFHTTGYLPTSNDAGKYLRVRAVYTDLHETAENAISAATANPVAEFVAPEPTAPTAPSISGATSGPNGVTVTWQAPADNGGSPITGYEVRVLQNGTQVGQLRPAGAGATSLVIDGLTPGSYTFTVAARNDIGLGAASGEFGPVNVVAGVAPTVTSHVPDADATGVAPDSNIDVFFSEPVTGYAGSNVTLKEVGSDVEVPINRGFNTSLLRLRLNPYGALADVLESGTEYEVTLNGGSSAIRNAAGVPMETTSFRFTTAETAAPAPTVVSSTPANGDNNVAAGASVLVFFSEAINRYGGDRITMTDADGNPVPFTAAWNATLNRLVVNPYGGDPDVLEPGATYTVTLKGGANGILSAAAGTPIAEHVITFTTSEATIPSVLSQNPMDGANDVPLNQVVTVFFSEALTRYGGANVTMVDEDGNDVPFTRGFNATTNRLMVNPFGGDPDTLEPGTTYTVTLKGGSSGIRSLSGTPIVEKTISFRTREVGEATPVTVLGSNPADGDDNVGRARSLTVNFSGAITGYGGDNVTLVDAEGNSVSATVAFNPTSNNLVVNPFGGGTTLLEAGTEYTVTLKGGATGIRSLSGVPLAEDMTITFTTRS